MTYRACPVKIKILLLLSLSLKAALLEFAIPASGQVLWTLDGNGAWENADNWSSAPALPGPSDDVVIDVGGQLVRTVTHGVGEDEVRSLDTRDALRITGGALAVADQFAAHGVETYVENARLDVAGPLILDGATLRARPGGTIQAAAGGVLTDAGANRMQLVADGIGASLSIPAVTTLAGHAAGPNTIVQALAGGSIDLSAVETIDGGAVNFDAQGPGSVIDLSALTSFVDTNPNDFSRLAARAGAKIIAPNLVDLDAVALWVDGAGQIDTAQITNLNKAEAYASGGGGLAFPLATTYVDQASFRGIFRAESGGAIDLSAATTFTGHAAGPNTTVQAFSGGSIDLSGATAIDGGAVNFDAQGPGSVIDLSALTSFVDTNPNDFSRIAARGGGRVIAPNLVDLDAVALWVDGAGQLDTAQITNLNKAEAYASGGGEVSFPQATTYVDQASFRGVFRAESGGSIDLSAVASFTGHAAGPNTSVQALSGGSIDLSGVETIDGGAVYFDSQGEGSVIDLSALTSFVDTNANDFSRLSARGGGKIIAPNLVDLDAVSLLVDGAGQLDTAQITNLNRAEVYASGGGGLAFPQATTYVDEASFRGVFRAESGGSIDLSAITSFTGHAAGPNTTVQALFGGTIDLSSVETIDGGAVYFDSQGDGSVIDLSSLTSFADTNPNDFSRLAARNRGEIRLVESTLSLSNVEVYIEPESEISVGRLEIQGATGSLTGTGVLAGDIVNAALTRVGTVGLGKLEVAGDFEQTASGRLTIRLAGNEAETGFGVLQIGGAGVLDGRLEVSRDQGFTPSLGESFRVVTATSLAGEFSEGGASVSADAWVTPVVVGSEVYLLTALAGDTDLDGDVDLFDFSALKSNFGLADGSKRSTGDNDGDGDTDLTDFARMKGAFGRSDGPTLADLGAGGAIVLAPEPHAALLLLLAAGAASTYLLAGSRR